MEESIQFIANCREWVAIKKLKVTEKTEPKTVMEFLASLGTGIDRKVEESLRQLVGLERLDAALNEVISSAGNAGEAIQGINSRAVTSVINELSSKPELQKNEQKELGEFLKVYATRKALKELKVRVDYSGIEIPGMKKAKKAKT